MRSRQPRRYCVIALLLIACGSNAPNPIEIVACDQASWARWTGDVNNTPVTCDRACMAPDILQLSGSACIARTQHGDTFDLMCFQTFAAANGADGCCKYEGSNAYPEGQFAECQ